MSQSAKIKELEKKLKEIEQEEAKETIQLKIDELDKKLSDTDTKITFGNIDEFDVLLHLKTKESFRKYLNEFAEGKHLNDTLLGDLLAFRSKYSDEIEKFLADMKVEPFTELYYLRDLLLGCCTFFRENDKQMSVVTVLCEIRAIEKKRLFDTLIMKKYENMLEKKNINATLFVNLLLASNDFPINTGELIDLLEAGNGRALILLAISIRYSDDEDYAKCVRWVRRGIAQNDYVAYVIFATALDDMIKDKYPDLNKFTLSTTDEFKELLQCHSVLIDFNLIIKPKVTVFDFNFFEENYNVSPHIREVAIKNTMKILTNCNFSNKLINDAYKFFCTIVLNHENYEKDDTFQLLMLNSATEDLDKFVAKCEMINILKKK